MASAEINIPDNAETLRCYKEEFAKKRAAAQKKKLAAKKSTGDSPAGVEQILESSPKRSLLKKRQRRASAIERQKKAASSSKDKSAGSDFEPDSPMKLLAYGLSSFKDPAGFLKRSDGFTLVEDDMYLNKVKTEEAYQAMLHLHGRYKAINEKSVALHKAGDPLKAENAKLSTEKILIEQQKAALEEELRNKRARHQAEDYLSGDHSKWNPQTMQEEIDIYEEMQRLKLEESQGAGDDGDVENADGNLGDDASLDKDEAAAATGPPQDG
ncbi:hypothetical protein LWI28_014456 [Acer negundo]|uniref:Uncharacterized protein n=1 Tax=Acer negundo TaxID=4023 RepID=A0AAD5JGJ9_ACENE|nr:hypothetical protein LWI28_014456 [Acer negundo]